MLLSIENEHKNYIFIFSKIVDRISIQKPNLNDDGYAEFELDISFLKDIKTMDKNQLILSYGKFYPDYLSGDLTEIYDCLYDNLLSKGYIK